ncbi:DUF6702 family protein [Sandarakinorhabdus rubra]|uniref:DUF6702 family protein n=1 Tax=Sandarakinorhabdus rubra TaxID=2672568 RepID=UPI0013DCB1C9|nr:DUF6702 family protein [Sandarakinorhabdus rubra]
MNIAAGLLALLFALLAGPAAAHRGHATLSVVEIDAATGAVAVTHRMAAHDVEPTLVNLAPDAQPSLDDPAAVGALVAYLGRAFAVRGVPLQFVGQTLAGDTVIMRYAGTLAGRPDSLTIAGALFGATWSDHTTQVNVRRGGETRTLVFAAGDPPKTVPLPGR